MPRLWIPLTHTARPSRERLTSSIRGIGVRQVRLVSGMILFAYLVSHFLNHALGNISLEAMADGVRWHTAFWQFLPVAILFYAACLVHTALGLWALYERRQFRWKTMELMQLALGLTIPVLVIAHVLGVRLAYTFMATKSFTRRCCSPISCHGRPGACGA